MNEVTKLFIEHLRRSSAIEAAGDWVADLDACDEAPEGTKAAAFKYMSAIHHELLAFVGTIDLSAAAVEVQE